MTSRTRDRRHQLDRAGIAEYLGVSLATVNRWHLQRATSGFPAKADTDGRDWWWQQDIDAFHTAYLSTRAAGFTAVDRHGEPDDLLTAPESARVLGYKNHRSLPTYLIDHPDRVERLASRLLRRYWYRRTLWDWADQRALRHSTGRPAGQSEPRPPHPYAEDPRLQVAIELVAERRAEGHSMEGLGSELARRLGISERTGQRLVRAAFGQEY